MFKPKTKTPQTATTPRENFPTFRRWARLDFPTLRRLLRFMWKVATRLPFVSRAWWKRNYRRLAATCLALAAFWTTTNIYATILLNRELAAIRQRGEPLTLAELAPPPVPDDQNAALLYIRANAMLEKNPLYNKTAFKLLRPSQSYFTQRPKIITSELQRQAARRRITDEYSDVIPVIRAASRLPFNRSSQMWDKPKLETVGFPTTSANFNSVMYLMRFCVEQEAVDGRTEQALEDVKVIYSMSKHVGADPFLVPYFTSNMLENNGYGTLSQIIEYSNFTDSQRKLALAILPQNDPDVQWMRAMRGERAIGHLLFSKVSSGATNLVAINKAWGTSALYGDVSSPILWLMSKRLGRLLWLPFFKMDEVWYLRSHPANSQAVPFSDVPSYALATRVMSPAFVPFHKYAKRTTTWREMARVGIELNFYRAQHKTYPETLAQLNIEVPRDSFTQKPFVYRRTKTAYQLYSVGSNKADDGGRTEVDYFRTHPNQDYVFNGSMPVSPWDDITWPPSKDNA